MEHVLEESIPGIKIKKKNNNINFIILKIHIFQKSSLFHLTSTNKYK